MLLVPQGPIGPTGSDGVACWDLNGNGVFKIWANEDINGDGSFDALDCQGSIMIGTSQIYNIQPINKQLV